MHVLILDGDPRPAGTELDRELTKLVARTEAEGHGCDRVRLAALRLHQCVGCFDCWLATPGRCRLRDDGARIVALAARSDLLVLASPMRMGFVTSLLKRACDRLIPILLPYIDVAGGECHHRMRYGRGLDVALLLERGDASDEELGAATHVFERLALNLRGRLAWTKVLDSPQEARDALDAA